MSKRKGKVISDATAVKSRRVTPVGTEDTLDDSIHQGPSSKCFPHSGDIGIVESITLKNFMCHHLLGPFQFGPNVNFIVGNNGSGKSAILTALIVGLGGKATFTNRGVSLKDFVKTGDNTADITIKLRNRGPDAYKRDVYGDSISIEHRISSDGSRTCKLKSKSGQLISNKKEELTTILDHFNIQLDNPVSILNQEMSKQFLHSKSESDKYKFFMKATLLEQMKRDYIHIKHTKTVTRQQVERQEECLKDLKQEFLQRKERYENLSSFSEMKVALENLKKAMAWCLVRIYLPSFKKKKNCEDFNRVKLKEQVKAIKTDYAKRLKTLSSLKEQLTELENKCSQLNQDIKNKHQALLKGKEERDKLRYHKIIFAYKQTCCQGLIEVRVQLIFHDHAWFVFSRLEERDVQLSYESKLKRKNQLLASRSNKLKRFGDHVPNLLGSITEAYATGRFLKKPVGPIGACISLKDPTLAVAVECCLRSFMKAFCCDNYKDELVLQELMSHYYPKGNRPQIIVSPFSEKVYNIHGRKACHPEYPSLLDIITATSPVIINCLIDMRGIESVLIIKVNKARRVMQQGRPPKNCREAFTVEGDQVYPNRYYTSEFSMAKYLGLLLCFKLKCLSLFICLKDEQLKLEAECAKHERNLKILENKLKSHEDNIQAMKGELAQREEELQEYVTKATKISPERQQVTGSTKSIDTEITRLKKKIKKFRLLQFLPSALIREYAEALALYREKTNQVRDLRRFIDRLDNIMSDRQNRYKIMRRSLSVRCKLYFNNFLIKMNCCGSMIFDHNNETLSISVKPPGREDDGVSDMRSLSGGERSFSTVCFMLSLWEITESPFRCLDEFDVYMDMHNRRISLDLLLELSERQHLRQFIFITPLTTRSLPQTNFIKIHQLQDPERTQSETENEDV
uniref:Structural maintenance of chromosomes protein 6 n=1 Tax=Anabas testudineus TaxID=64144 RepID=A0A7N5ZST4_ANATE